MATVYHAQLSQASHANRCVALLVFVFLSVCGCRDRHYIAKIDLCPGMEWRMVEYGLSEVHWGDKGVVAQGDLSISFCDDGINVLSGRGNVLYLDVVNGSVLKSRGSFVPARSSEYIGGHFFSATAEGVMGPYGRASYKEFVAERERFLSRLGKMGKTGSSPGGSRHMGGFVNDRVLQKE